MLRATRTVINKARVKFAVATTCFRRITAFSAQTVRYVRQFDDMSDTVSLLETRNDEISGASEMIVQDAVAENDILKNDGVVKTEEDMFEGENKSETASPEENDLIDWDIDVNQNYLDYKLDLSIGSCYDLTQSDDEKFENKIERHYEKKFYKKLSRKFNRTKLAYLSTSMHSILTICSNDEISVASEMVVQETVAENDNLKGDGVVESEEDMFGGEDKSETASSKGNDLIDWDIDVNQNYLDYNLDLSIGSCYDLTQSDDESSDDKVEKHYKKKFYKKFSKTELAFLSTSAHSTLTIRSNKVRQQGRIRLSLDESDSNVSNDSEVEHFDIEKIGIEQIDIESSDIEPIEIDECENFEIEQIAIETVETDDFDIEEFDFVNGLSP